jgi:hypothetical protein
VRPLPAKWLVTSSVAIAVITGSAAASSPQPCRRACRGFIATCAKATLAAGFGDQTRACTRTILKRCRREGAAACVAYCGNNVIDPGEECDGSTFNGATCASLGFTNGGTLACTAQCRFDVSGCKSQAFPATGQTSCWYIHRMPTAPTACATFFLGACIVEPEDGFFRAGAKLSYTDNGDGTITDVNTGLMWEKQSYLDGSVHDVTTVGTWDAAFSHVEALDGAGFAGYSDWRVPNYKELVSILNLQQTGPATSQTFQDPNPCTTPCTVISCSCTGERYWSSTTYAPIPDSAYNVSFVDGTVSYDAKMTALSVRAVRGGSGANLCFTPP